MVFGFGEKALDPRDGKRGSMTARSSWSNQARKQRMTEPPAEALKPRHDLVARTSTATYSTVMRGRGLGIVDWVPFKPVVARKWEWELPDEPAVDDSLSHDNGELTSIEKAFARWGSTPPAWLVKAEHKYRARLKEQARKKGKKKKKKQGVGDEPEEEAVRTVPVPETVSGMLLETVRETGESYTRAVSSRIEYQRRIREMEGPGPLERALLDYIVVPLVLVGVQIYLHLSAYWRVTEGFSRKIDKEDDNDEEEEKPKIATWHELEVLQHRIQTVAAIAALVSVLVGVLVNELQFRGFIPGWSEDCSNPDVPRSSCKNNPTCAYIWDGQEARYLLQCAPHDVNKFGFVDKLKFFNTALTAFIIFTEYFYYQYEANIFSLRNHTEFVDRELRSYWLHQCGLLKWYLIECAFLVVHQMPFFYYDIIIQTSYFSDRPSVYSLDGIIALLMLVRVWQVWKWYRGYLFTRFASRRHAIRMNDEQTGSLLAVRLFVLDNPLLAIMQVFLAVVMLGSFMYRIAESSTNEVAGVYYWDCMWFMINAMTGLPIADKTLEPEGTFGRVIAVAVRFVGIFWFILVLTAVRGIQKYDAAETQFFGWIRKSSLNTIVKISAARVIQYMWLYGIDHWSTLRQLDRFRIAQQNQALADRDSENPEVSDFDVFKRSVSTRMSEMRKMVDNIKEGLDKDPAQDAETANGNQEPATQMANKGVTIPKTREKIVTITRTVSGEKGGASRAPSKSTSWPANERGSTTVSASHFGAPPCGRLDYFSWCGDEMRGEMATKLPDVGQDVADLVEEFGASCMFQVGCYQQPKFACGWCGKAYRDTCALRYHLKLGCCSQHARCHSSHGDPVRKLERRSHIASLSQTLGNDTPSLPVDDNEQRVDEAHGVLDSELHNHAFSSKVERGIEEYIDGPGVEEVLRELLMNRLLLEHLPVVMQGCPGKEVDDQQTLMPHLMHHPYSHQHSTLWQEERPDEEEEGACPGEECSGFDNVEQDSSGVWQQTRFWKRLGHAHDREAHDDVERHEHVEDQMLGVDAQQNTEFAGEQGKLSVMCHGSSFGKDSTAKPASDEELQLLDVQDDVLPGQVSSPTRRSAPVRAPSYSHTRASLHAEGGGRKPEEVVAGARFGEGDGTAPARTISKGVQFADIDSPRGKPKKKIGFVGGEMNYGVILSQKEKELIKAKTLNDQIQSALTQMRDLRVANDELLRSCGVEPGLVDEFGNEKSPEEDEREPEPWELDMMNKLARVEKRFTDLDGVTSEIMGQILLLIQGLYIKRGMRVPDTKPS